MTRITADKQQFLYTTWYTPLKAGVTGLAMGFYGEFVSKSDKGGIQLKGRRSKALSGALYNAWGVTRLFGRYQT
ncbi:hypothetical protein [Buttiauxella gaviniae]|uniref:hypothetical protein n=1 Tax=Buttiauxella gaviniae TaxID=82990 RepID=UPI003C70C4EB